MKKIILILLFSLSFLYSDTTTRTIIYKDEVKTITLIAKKGSCKNYKTRFFCEIKKCGKVVSNEEVASPSECQNKEDTTSGELDSDSSFIDNRTFNYIHYATDYLAEVNSSGCGPCGDASISSTLTPLSVTRYHRFRNVTEQSSFGGGVFSNWDTTLTLFKDSKGRSRIDISNPNDLNTRRLFPQNGKFFDTFARSYNGLTLFKLDGSTTTDVLQGHVAELKTRSGRTFLFEIFSIDEFSKAGRLVSIKDRNGYAHIISYEINQDVVVDDYKAKFRMASITDPNNRQLTFTYLTDGTGEYAKRKGSFPIRTMTKPDGNVITYNYGSTSDSGLESVDYPDGTSSTFTVDMDSDHTRVHFFEAGQEGFDRRKSAYLTNNFVGGVTSDGLEYYNSSSLLVNFVTKGKVNTETEANNEEVTYAGMVDGHIMHRKIYEGGGKMKWVDIDVARFYDNWSLGSDLTLGSKAITGSRESKYPHGSWRNYAGNRQGRPPFKYDRQGVRYTYMYNAEGSKTRKNYPDGSYEQWAYNEFQQAVRYRDRLGRVTLNHFDERGNHLMSILGVKAEPIAAGSERLTGLFYNLYDGTWNQLPNFSSLTPIDFGVLPNAEINATDRADKYGMTFEGDIEITTGGDYMFTTGSDDGSKLYINDIEVVNNDGLHGLVEVDSAPVILTPGYHKIRIEFFEKGGNQKLFAYYNGPDTANEKILIPDNVLSHMATGLTEQDVTTPETAVVVKQYYPESNANHKFLLQYEFDPMDFPSGGSLTDYTSLINTVVTTNTKRKEFKYNADRQLEEIIEPDDAGTGYHVAWTFDYDTAKRLYTSTDAGSVLTELPVTDDNRRTTKRFYDDRDRLIKLVYNDTSTELFIYGTGDDANLLVKQKDRNGNVTKFIYDDQGRLEEKIEAYEWMSADGTVTDANDASLQLETKFTYLNGTELVETQTVGGNKTTFGYDYRHRQVETAVEVDVDTTLVSSKVFKDNLLFCTTDPYGRSTYYNYRPEDSKLIRIVKGTLPSYSLTSFNQVANAVRATTPNASHLITDYVKDVAGQTTETFDGRNIRHTNKYNTRGWLVESVKAADSLAAKTEFYYDAYGNQLEVRHPRYFDSTDVEGYQQASTSFTYTRRQKLASRTEASSSTLAATMSYTYFNDGRAYQTFDFRNNMSEQEWHRCCGRLQANIDEAGHASFNNTDFAGNSTHTGVLEDYPGIGSVAGQQSVHNADDSSTMREVTTRYDARHRPVATTVWLEKLGNVDANDVPISTDAGEIKEGLTTTYLYYDEVIGHEELKPLYDKLVEDGIEFTENTGSAVVTLNPENEVAISIQDGAGRTVASGMIDKTTWAIDSEGTLLTWKTIIHDQVEPSTGLLVTESLSALNFSNKAFSDGAARTWKTQDAEGNFTQTEFDNNSNVIKSVDANAVGLDSCEYDDLNRDISCTDTQKETISTTYNLANQPISSTDAKLKLSSAIYDVRGRTVSITNRSGDTLSYKYDLNNNLTAIWDENQLVNAYADYSKATRYKYDVRNLLVATSLPGHPASVDLDDGYIDFTINQSNAAFDLTTCSYDALGRRKVCIDQQGDSIKSIFDLASRVTSREYREFGTPVDSDVSQAESVDEFVYDKASRLLSAYKGRYNNSVILTYDEIGRKKTETVKLGEVEDNSVPSYTTTCHFDLDSREITCNYPQGKNLENTFTSRNQLEAIKFDSANVIEKFEYDAGMREESRKFGNSLITTRAYRNDNTFSSISTTGKDELSFIYENLANPSGYDANKNVKQEITGGVTAGYSWRNTEYDDIDRIKDWNRDNGFNQSWNLDAIGNWDSVTTNGVSEIRGHNDVNEIVSIDSDKTPIDHDQKGNVTTLNGKTLEYDIDNHLRFVSQGTLALAEFTYDALGRRLEKKAAKDILYISLGHRVIEEYEKASSNYILTRTYIHGTYIDDLVAKIEANGDKHYFHSDRQFNVRSITDANGDILELYAYSPFGKQTILDSTGSEIGVSTISNNYGFTGRYLDAEVDLWYFRARYFSDELGRFTSRDPLKYVDGMNLYNGYFAEEFALDPMGTVKWKGGKRGGGERTTVIMEKWDSIERVAKFVGLEPNEFKKWLDKESLDKRVCTLTKCGMRIRDITTDSKLKCGDVELSVPNTIYAIKGDDTGNGFWVKWEWEDFIRDKTAEGFNVVKGVAKQEKVNTYFSDPNIHGVGYFGHGSNGQWSLFDSPKPYSKRPDILQPSLDFHELKKNLHHQLGYILSYSCQGAGGMTGRSPSNCSNGLMFLSFTNGKFFALESSFRPIWWDWNDLPEYDFNF